MAELTRSRTLAAREAEIICDFGPGYGITVPNMNLHDAAEAGIRRGLALAVERLGEMAARLEANEGYTAQVRAIELRHIERRIAAMADEE